MDTMVIFMSLCPMSTILSVICLGNQFYSRFFEDQFTTTTVDPFRTTEDPFRRVNDDSSFRDRERGRSVLAKMNLYLVNV